MSEMTALEGGQLLTVLAIGIITFAYRFSFILFADRLSIPTKLRHALRFVPIAALTAIITPEVLQYGGKLNLSLGNLRLIASIVAIAVAWRTKNVLWTILFGMGSLWILQFWFS